MYNSDTKKEVVMKVLVLGSVCLDVLVEIDHLPSLSEDVNTEGLSLSLGGMAYNVYNVIKLFNQGCILGCPIGEGKIANLVKDMLKAKEEKPIGVIEGLDNGMCLCLVDKSKDRSFISHHGAEYRFNPEFFRDINFDEISYIYVSGLEIEDVDGLKIIEFLETKKRPVFLALGPRANEIKSEYLKRLYALKPILHINEREAELISGVKDINQAIDIISEITKNSVIVTLGEEGSKFKEYQKNIIWIKSDKVEMVDATGAGDNHAGSILACLNQGLTLEEAIKIANKISASVVTQIGASLTQENFNKALENCKKA